MTNILNISVAQSFYMTIHQGLDAALLYTEGAASVWNSVGHCGRVIKNIWHSVLKFVLKSDISFGQSKSYY